MTKFGIVTYPPIVELIGLTQPVPDAIQRVMNHRDTFWNTDPIKNDPLALAEFGGRVCYESFDNKKNRSRIEYIKDTALNKEHGSIIEHCWFNFAVLDLPRNSLLELTRHRVGVAYSWRSTRYVDNWISYAAPPLIRNEPDFVDRFIWQAKQNFTDYESNKLVFKERFKDASRKQIIEAARSVLSGSATSDGEFTVNLRELLHILKLRSSEGADKSMQEFAAQLYAASKEYIQELVDEELYTQITK